MKTIAIALAIMMLVVVIAGCTTQTNVVTENNETLSNAQNAITDFESTLIDESDDVEIGSLL